MLKGDIRNIKKYFEADQKRYFTMLDDIKKRWLFYMSELETRIIEDKLILIVESLTFKYTRQPEMLSLIPDRIDEVNLRLS